MTFYQTNAHEREKFPWGKIKRLLFCITLSSVNLCEISFMFLSWCFTCATVNSWRIQDHSLKIGHLYKHQLRIQAWQFLNGKLPRSRAIFQRVSEVHEHATRSAVSEISRSTGDQRLLSYRVPKEWSALPGDLRKLTSKATFKVNSKKLFIQEYSEYVCHGTECRVCGGGDLSAEPSQRGQETDPVGGSFAVGTSLKRTS